MKVSEFDLSVLHQLRKNVDESVRAFANLHDSNGVMVLDIAPQDHVGAKKYFKNSTVKTLDIDPDSGADFIADICINNSEVIKSESFDIIVCTEVLEHTLQPFYAADELYRILKRSGEMMVSTPFDFRIHGPLPDCWRFTEHGLRALFSKFSSVNVIPFDNEDRFLMPYQYLTVLKK